MAVPTLVSLTPSIGLASGDQLITIVGTNFNVPVGAPPGTINGNDPYDAQSLGTVTQTAMVLFDGVPSPLVKVYSSTFLTALLPPGDPGPSSTPPPGRAVTVQILNVTQGTTNPIMGESVSVTSAFTYTRPIMTSEYESDFTRAVRTFIQLLKRQLIVDEVNWAVQTDYDEKTGDELHVTKFAKLPGIALVGPDLRENRFYSLNEQPDYPDGTISPLDGESSAGFLETRVPYTVDVLFTVIGASNNKAELLNLMANFIIVMHKNKWLRMDRSPTNAALGQVKYEMDFEPAGLPTTTTVPNNSNVRSWSAKIVIRGFDIESISGLAIDGTSDPSELLSAHAVIDHGRNADDVVLAPSIKVAIDSSE